MGWPKVASDPETRSHDGLLSTTTTDHRPAGGIHHSNYLMIPPLVEIHVLDRKRIDEWVELSLCCRVRSGLQGQREGTTHLAIRPSSGYHPI